MVQILISKVNAVVKRIDNTVSSKKYLIYCDKLEFNYVDNRLSKEIKELLLSKNEGKLL